MRIRLLLAVPDAESLELMHSLLDAALRFVALDVKVDAVRSREELMQRVQADLDDVIFLDWLLAGADTPDFVRQITGRNCRLRVSVLLPLQLRQYRQRIWDAGACASIPKEYMDQEWLSTALCIIHRAMEREARLALSRA